MSNESDSGSLVEVISPNQPPSLIKDLVADAQLRLEQEIDRNISELVLMRENAIYSGDKIKAIDTMMKYTKRMRPDSIDTGGGHVNVNVFVSMLTGKQ